MKLEAEGVPVLKRLHRKIVALGQQFGADGQFEPFAMPVIDLLRPVRAERVAGVGRADRIIADLARALADAARRGRRAAWRASARPGKCRGTAAARAAEPRSSRSRGERNRRGSLALIGPPKMTAPACSSSVSGRGSPKRGPADVEGMAERAQRIADAAGRRGFLVQDDQDRQQGTPDAAARRLPALHRERAAISRLILLRPERHRLCMLCGTQAASIAK